MRLLKKGELDLTFTRHNFHSDEIESQFVIREPLIFILPKDHPLAKYDRIPVKLLNDIDFIIPSAEQSQTLHHTILDFAKANGLNLILSKRRIIFCSISTRLVWAWAVPSCQAISHH